MGILAKELRNNCIATGSLTDHSDFWYGVNGGPTKAGVNVSEESAIKYLAVFSCVSLIADDLARLPLILYQNMGGDETRRATEQPLYDIMHNAPNKDTTSFNWREVAENHCLTWGNSYNKIERFPRTGEIKSITQIPRPGTVAVKRNRKGIYYEWHGNKNAINEQITAETVGGGLTRFRVPKRDIFHIPGWSMNGLVGMSMIAIAREAIGLGIAAGQFGSEYFGQGIHPSAIFKTDKNLGDNRNDYINSVNSQYGGLGKSHKAMVLEMGIDYKQIEIPMDDAQFLQTREFQKLDICGMYKVPPHKIAIHGKNSNNNNLEQENGSYVSQCLMPWLVRWEQNMNFQLLTQDQRQQGYYFEFLVDGLLRGDSKARALYYKSMWEKGAMSANDINKLENRNPVESGDQYFVPLNFIPSDQAADFATPKEQKSSRQLEYRAASSIGFRDRIAKQYYPLFKAAADSIVNREAIAVKREVNKQSKKRASTSMQNWLDDFYASFPVYIRQKIGPVITSFSSAIQAASAGEMGIEVGVTEDFEKEVNEYISVYADRHTSSSHGQLSSLTADGLDALTERVEEWQETRPEKIATNETVRNSSFIYQSMAFAVGLTTVLRNRGPKTCPFCVSLNGKKVTRGGGPLVVDGQELEGANTDEPPMLIRGDKFHTPIHQSCDCFMSII